MEYFKYCLKHYIDFSGRARRMEYWSFTLFQFIAMAFAAFLGLAIDFAIGSYIIVTPILVTLVCLGLILPGVAVFFRRLHDIGKSGWWIIFGLVPVVGEVALLVFMFLDSEPGSNRYGPNPKSA